MNIEFCNEWQGWRLSGRFLVSEDGQRMTVERLRGLMWRDAMELRRAGYQSRRKAEKAKGCLAYRQMVKVVVIDLGEYRRNGVAAA